MTNFLFVLLIVLSMALGVVIGETYAPLSGHTTQRLDNRLSTVEGQTQTSDLRCTQLESRVVALEKHVHLER